METNGMDSTKDFQRRVRQYWYEDGLIEIGAGCAILLIAGIYLSAALFMKGPVGALVTAFAPMLVILLWVLGGKKLIQTLKEKITYPRTGYVKYRQDPRTRSISRRVLVMIVAASVSGLVILFAASIPKIYYAALTGIMAAAIMFILGYQANVKRFYLVGIWVILSGLVISLLPIVEPWDMPALVGSMGLGWIVSGIVALTNYLKHTSPAGPNYMEEL